MSTPALTSQIEKEGWQKVADAITEGVYLERCYFSLDSSRSTKFALEKPEHSWAELWKLVGIARWDVHTCEQSKKKKTKKKPVIKKGLPNRISVV
jgi:hypothetical protein